MAKKETAITRPRRRRVTKPKKKKRRGKARMSLTKLLAFAVAPIATFAYGVVGYTQGAAQDGQIPLGIRMKNGMNSLILAYFGYDFMGRRFVPQALLQGYLPVLGAYAVSKIGINKMIGRNAPLLL